LDRSSVLLARQSPSLVGIRKKAHRRLTSILSLLLPPFLPRYVLSHSRTRFVRVPFPHRVSINFDLLFSVTRTVPMFFLNLPFSRSEGKSPRGACFQWARSECFFPVPTWAQHADSRSSPFASTCFLGTTGRQSPPM